MEDLISSESHCLIYALSAKPEAWLPLGERLMVLVSISKSKDFKSIFFPLVPNLFSGASTTSKANLKRETGPSNDKLSLEPSVLTIVPVPLNLKSYASTPIKVLGSKETLKSYS